MSLIILTKSAEDKIDSLLKAEGNEHFKLRIAVMPGGCAGLQYDLFFDDKVLDTDSIVGEGSVKVIVDKNSVEHIKGSTLDYNDGLVESGFKIENPNASSGCGCGKSFC